MAVLSDVERTAAWVDAMQSSYGIGSVTKPDLRLAVNAIDDFLETNAGAINTAIPQPARSALTTKQKAVLLMLIVARRYVVSP